MSRTPSMFGTFSITVDGTAELCHGTDTLQQRQDTRKHVHPLPVNCLLTVRGASP
jgi:hypothetical protein